LAAGVGDAPQAPPHQHVATSGNPCPWVYVSKQQYAAGRFEMVSGAQGALMHL
jgi:hypothetical protein